MRHWLHITRHLAFVALVGACVALAVLNIQAWRGDLVDEKPASAGSVDPPAATAEAAGDVAPTTSSAQSSAPATSPESGIRADTPASAREPAVAPATITVKATSGPCWLLARAESADGKILYEGVLARGKSLTLERDRVWLRLGAPANVQLSLNGEAVRDVVGATTDLIATSAGVRPASAGT